MNSKFNKSNDTNEKTAKKVWKLIGIGALAVFLAVFTVFVINL